MTAPALQTCLVSPAECDRLIGQSVDIAPSAYEYRADRPAAENAPESWLALMHFAGLPLNGVYDPATPAIARILRAFLWEEFRPIHRLRLTWEADGGQTPAAEDVAITTLNAGEAKDSILASFSKNTASTWWHNLAAAKNEGKPKVLAEGRSWEYRIEQPACGLVVSLAEGRTAADGPMPTVEVLIEDTWRRMAVEVEFGCVPTLAERDYSGHLECYDGRIAGLRPLADEANTILTDARSWRSLPGGARRGLRFDLLFMGASTWRKEMPFTCPREDVARTIVTLWTAAGNCSFLAADLENGPILIPEHGIFIRRTDAPPSWQAPALLRSQATTARDFVAERRAMGLTTVRERVRQASEPSWESVMTAFHGPALPPHPEPPAGLMPSMRIELPCARLTAQWNLGLWHLTRHCGKNPENGRLWFDDFPFGILAAETFMILNALDLLGAHQAAEDGFEQWLSLPMQTQSKPGSVGWAGTIADRPTGLFTEGLGALTHAPGLVGHDTMDAIHAFGPGSIGWAFIEHLRLSADTAWLRDRAPRLLANIQWMLRQRQEFRRRIPGGERLWAKGLQPALQVTPDSGGLWMNFYEAEAFYCAAVTRTAEAWATFAPHEACDLQREAAAYRQDLLQALERSIALSPVVPVQDGTYRSVLPFACYVRGLANGAWGWLRDGSNQHAGPLYWDTCQSAAALISIAGLLSVEDARVQGWMDVLEDRLNLENVYVRRRVGADWRLAGWQHQYGLERTADLHLAADDIPGFLRTLYNCYAADLIPDQGYIFREHGDTGPADKIFEEAVFMTRLRNALVMEDGQTLWLARATPRVWLEQSKKISVKNAPTYFGTVAYEIVSDADHGSITATIDLPARPPAPDLPTLARGASEQAGRGGRAGNPPKEIRLRLRHPKTAPIRSVTVNGKAWADFNPGKEFIVLQDLSGTVAVTALY